ncbi:polysaccharide lyase 6 family protein [Planctomicrobium piriforme]|uniref:Poly(Beta-D-mannuronate) lyase n=1 Tax=Planctomicrobium piriforme TaxID=1576369 RepID=A0A1I3PUF0_9PLAN|nr:polysaccharide lyase 6 family protein [Planctomicrobium piriforme]SFJ24851.1 poly(beta-D-mannuronate) lyase [Planctomicrobium piriforme]
MPRLHLAHVFCMLTLLQAIPVSAAEVAVANPVELAAALAQAKPGDAVVMQDGPWQDADILFAARGTAPLPITLKAQTPGGVILSGHTRLRFSGEYLVVSGLLFENAWSNEPLVQFRKDREDHATRSCQITNCSFLNCNRPGAGHPIAWVALYGQDHRIDHSRFKGKSTPGPILQVVVGADPNNHVIERNEFSHRPQVSQDEGSTIQIGDENSSHASSHTTLQSNLFDDCNGDGTIIANWSSDNVYRENTFRRCGGSIVLRRGNGCLLSGNFFLGEKARNTGGICVSGSDHQIVNNYFGDLTGSGANSALAILNGSAHVTPLSVPPVSNVLIAFNSFVHCHIPLNVGMAGRPNAGNKVPPQNCTVANNVFLGDGDMLDLNLLQGMQANQFTWIGNMVSRSANVPPLDGFKAVDLRMQSTENGLWRPRSNSPVVDAAVGNSGDVSIDFDGQTRTHHKDVGCDERVDEKITIAPLLSRDVGTDWTAAPRTVAKPQPKPQPDFGILIMPE